MSYVSMAEQIHIEFGDELHRLEKLKEITQDTAKTYLSAAQNIIRFMDQRGKKKIDEITQKDFEEFFEREIGNKNKFSAHKSALNRLKSIYPTLCMPGEDFFQSEAKQKVRNKTGGGSGLSEKTIMRKINAIRNEKMKVGYRLALATGLRVSEISRLTPENIKKIKGSNKLVIEVVQGKGRKDRKTIGLEDGYLVEKVRGLIQESASGKVLFYSKSYMMSEAHRLGFECHDLRRIYAKELLGQKRREGLGQWKAMHYVKKQLGHKKLRTTKIYLKGAAKNGTIKS